MTRLIFCVCSLVYLLTGCSGGSDDSPAPQTGTLTLQVTDAPVDSVVELWIQFTGVTLKPQDADALTIEFDAPANIDLRSLTGSNTSDLLDSHEVAAGDYNWIRLHVNAVEDGVMDSFVMTDTGQMIELEVSNQQFLQLVSGFTIAAGNNVSFVIDWDLRKGLTIPNNPNMDAWRLRPALRISNLQEAGSVSGVVEASYLTDASCTNDLAADTGNAVYLFAGHDAVAEDIHTEATDPIATTTVEQDMDGLYAYELVFLSPGEYTVAFTCQASDDEADTDDDVVFAVSANVTISEDESVVLNLE